MRPYGVAILGATGLVGQRLLQRLDGHPWFEVRALCASERSAGQSYAEAVRWRLAGDPPEWAAARVVSPCRPEAARDCDLALSALDAAVAREVEPAFAEAGLAVVSNASAFRQQDDVPLLMPEINADHVALLERQSWRSRGGSLVTNPNCSTTGLALALAPLHRAARVTRVVATTLQAVSGAGLDGPSALEMIDNVIPWIAGEEEKIELELGKLLGRVDGAGLRRAELAVSAHCHRVGSIDGHLEAVSLATERPLEPAEAIELLRSFRGDHAELDLPSAAQPPLRVRDEPDRPQPRLDRDAGGGMAVVVGRVRRCPVLGLKLELLSHNTVRGAAGGTVLNAELLAARELLPRRSAA